MYLNDWEKIEDMKASFWPSWSDKYEYNGELDGLNVLLASYGSTNYDGDAFVLFERDGKLYEVNAGHCSCYGLEDQWCPEETTVEALLHRLNHGNLGADKFRSSEFAAELRQVLSAITHNA